MNAVPLSSRKLILEAAIAMTTVQVELMALKGQYLRRGLDLPPEMKAVERLVTALQAVFDYSSRNGFTLENAVEAMGRDMTAEMDRLRKRYERLRQSVMN